MPAPERNPGRSWARIQFFRLCSLVSDLFLLLVYRRIVLGRRNIPPTGPVLLLASHQSYLDVPLIGTAARPRQINPLAREGLFRVPLLAPLIRALNAIPLGEGRSDPRAIRAALASLEARRMVLVFPEGSRSFDGRLAPYKRGAWLLVSRSRCPVVPVAVEGCFDAWPRSRSLPAIFGRRRIAVMFGPAVPYEELRALGPDAGLALLASRTDAMRLELRALLRDATGGRFPPPGPGDAPSDLPPPPTHLPDVGAPAAGEVAPPQP